MLQNVASESKKQDLGWFGAKITEASSKVIESTGAELSPSRLKILMILEQWQF